MDNRTMYYRKLYALGMRGVKALGIYYYITVQIRKQIYNTNHFRCAELNLLQCVESDLHRL